MPSCSVVPRRGQAADAVVEHGPRRVGRGEQRGREHERFRIPEHMAAILLVPADAERRHAARAEGRNAAVQVKVGGLGAIPPLASRADDARAALPQFGPGGMVVGAEFVEPVPLPRRDEPAGLPMRLAMHPRRHT